MDSPEPRPAATGRLDRYTQYAVILGALSLAVIAVVLVWFALQVPELLDLLREAIAAMEELARAIEEGRV